MVLTVDPETNKEVRSAQEENKRRGGGDRNKKAYRLCQRCPLSILKRGEGWVLVSQQRRIQEGVYVTSNDENPAANDVPPADRWKEFIDERLCCLFVDPCCAAMVCCYIEDSTLIVLSIAQPNIK